MSQAAPSSPGPPPRLLFRLELTESETDRLARLAEAEGISEEAALRGIVRERLNETPSADDLAGDLAGCLDGPADLASNPDHLRDFGS